MHTHTYSHQHQHQHDRDGIRLHPLVGGELALLEEDFERHWNIVEVEQSELQLFYSHRERVGKVFIEREGGGHSIPL